MPAFFKNFSLLTKFKDFDFFIAFHHFFMIAFYAVTLQQLFLLTELKKLIIFKATHFQYETLYTSQLAKLRYNDVIIT